MDGNQTQRVSVMGYLILTLRSRISKAEKNEPNGEKKRYRSYYLPIMKEDLVTKGLSEGDRITLGIIKVDKAPVRDPKEEEIQDPTSSSDLEYSTPNQPEGLAYVNS